MEPETRDRERACLDAARAVLESATDLLDVNGDDDRGRIRTLARALKAITERGCFEDVDEMHVLATAVWLKLSGIDDEDYRIDQPAPRSVAGAVIVAFARLTLIMEHRRAMEDAIEASDDSWPLGCFQIDDVVNDLDRRADADRAATSLS